RTDMHKEKNRDLTGVLTGNKLGLDDMTGNQKLYINSSKHNGTANEMTLTGSTIGSSAGNVSLTAGRELKVVASDLVSTKNMELSGADVTVTSGMETASQTSKDSSKSLAVGRVIAGTVVDTANSIRDAAEAARSSDDPRLKAVKIAQAALSMYNLNNQAGDLAKQSTGFKDKTGGSAGNGSFIKIGTELANTRTKSSSEYTAQTAHQSNLNAGGKLSIIAAGDAPGTVGDLTITGSTLKADSTLLSAKNNILMQSAQNTTDRKNDGSRNRTAIGASFNIGEQNGFTIDLGAQTAKNLGSGGSVTQVNTTLDTGSLVLRSGQDTSLIGAQVRAERIDANIGGNLNILSRQDTETSKSKQNSAGFGASICIPPICYGSPVTASANLAASKMNSDYQAVTDQSGFFAGKGGYTIDVAKNTTLQGAVIASEATADKNLLLTDRLLVSDIKNKSEIKSQSAGVSVSGSYSSGASTLTPGALYGMSLNDSDHSYTRSAVSEGTIVVRNPEGAGDLVGLNRDTANANQRLDKPDEKAMQERMDLIKSSMELTKGIGDAIAAAKIRDAEDPTTEAGKATRQKLIEDGIANPTAEQVSQRAQKDYGLGSSFQRASQAVTAIVQAVMGGNVGGALAGAAAPYLAQEIKKKTEGDPYANLMAHAVLGAMVAQAQGNSALAGGTGAAMGELIARQLYPGTATSDLTQAQKETVSALSTLAAGVGGGLTGGDMLGASAGAQAGRNAVENNWLSETEARALDRELSACKNVKGDCGLVLKKYIEISNENSKKMMGRCIGGGLTCVLREEEIQASTNAARDADPSQFRLSEKLKNPEAVALVNYLNGSDLKFLKENITDTDRVMSVVIDPLSWPVMVMGGSSILTNALTKGKEQLIAVGASAGIGAAIQYGTTGKVTLSDVIGSGVVGAITAGKGYNPTVTWNATGGYYQAEMKGEDPFMGALLSKAGASVGFAVGNTIKAPLDKLLNPVSKQYEWMPTGIWTISRPASQSSVPSIFGNLGDSVSSGFFNSGADFYLKKRDNNEKE
ncbi:hemagglutinin repeat-containing protein, partial [Pseudomonas sp. JAI120]|uniref:hemagglutinin repeat-containing protein n=1 Tax=Pseudomonas sp. JAI120 TaxID=2723063 RepID=UPI00403F6E53